jgi:hypothetical protein
MGLTLKLYAEQISNWSTQNNCYYWQVSCNKFIRYNFFVNNSKPALYSFFNFCSLELGIFEIRHSKIQFQNSYFIQSHISKKIQNNNCFTSYMFKHKFGFDIPKLNIPLLVEMNCWKKSVRAVKGNQWSIENFL